MGRARRNQRDAIRKQRAKKRKKGQEESDDDSSVDLEDLYQQQSIPQKQETSEHNASTDSSKSSLKDQKKEDQRPAPRELSLASGTDTHQKEEASSLPIKAGTTIKKAPMDKIERMRLRKQQQKERRKEKKAAKAKLMQS